MKCPHCLVTIHEDWTTSQIATPDRSEPRDRDGVSWVEAMKCPDCKRMIIVLAVNPDGGATSVKRYLAWPRAQGRAPVPPDVPDDFAAEYREAVLVLADSPKASAALSRRCLQRLLRERARVRPGNLADEIQQVLNSGKIPTDLAEAIDAVRNIGNFAAHPLKSTSTGEIVDVEVGEADWLLDAL